MGMLATVINGLWLNAVLQRENVKSCLMNSIPIPAIAEPFVPARAIHALQKRFVLVLTGGTGNPFFTTDTAAVLRSLEIGADLFLKGTKVDGVYSSDPLQDEHATRFSRLSYAEALSMGVRVMDHTAFSLADEGNLEIIVFNLTEKGNLLAILEGRDIGTRISPLKEP
jgi:uridylate kinase